MAKAEQKVKRRALLRCRDGHRTGHAEYRACGEQHSDNLVELWILRRRGRCLPSLGCRLGETALRAAQLYNNATKKRSFYCAPFEGDDPCQVPHSLGYFLSGPLAFCA